jgi:hypothetical protein
MTLFFFRTVFTPEIIRDVVEYALQRGVRVIPEMDVPAHVGNGCFKFSVWLFFVRKVYTSEIIRDVVEYPVCLDAGVACCTGTERPCPRGKWLFSILRLTTVFFLQESVHPWDYQGCCGVCSVAGGARDTGTGRPCPRGQWLAIWRDWGHGQAGTLPQPGMSLFIEQFKVTFSWDFGGLFRKPDRVNFLFYLDFN